jgi:hypothetical protein
MAKCDSVTIEIVRWDELVYRKDIARPSWWRCPVDITTHPKYAHLKAEDLGVFMFVVSYAVNFKLNPITITSDNYVFKGRVPVAMVRDAVIKLPEYFRIVEEPIGNTLHNTTLQEKPDGISRVTRTEIDLEGASNEYPKRLGVSRKAEGIKRLKKQIKTAEDLDSLVGAIKAYREECDNNGKTGTQFVMQFSTFANCWREYVPTTQPPTDEADLWSVPPTTR